MANGTTESISIASVAAGCPFVPSGTPIPRAIRGVGVEWGFDVLAVNYEHELFQNTFTLSYNRGLADSY
jgi:hypothetical protein